VKLLIGVCRGKKKYDRREELKKKAHDLEVDRALKKFSR
ncbi:SsrA-binding protein, partial [Candidatus Peregrinibacteria bacterium]|nr:SsrA-binding protein [Candidatus Peregrinibacteria bacterium]